MNSAFMSLCVCGESCNQTRVDRDKPRTLEFGHRFMYFVLLLWTKEDSGLPTIPLTITKTSKHFFDNGLLEHAGLIHVLILAVHLLFSAEQLLCYWVLFCF